MTIEWGWLRSKAKVALPDRGIFLQARGGSMALLLHGLTGSPAELGYVAFHLQRRGGVTVHCPRLANHGQPLAVLARTTWRELYDSAKAAFFEARTEARARGIELAVGGLSIGANLALMLAAEYPEDVAGVACLSPTLFYDGWNVPWVHRLLPLARFTPLKNFAFMREGPPFGLKDEALRERIGARYDVMSLGDSSSAAALGYAHFPVRLFCELRPLIRHCVRLLPSVRAPLLLLQAENDDMTSPRNSQFIYDRVRSPRRELVLLRNSYHLVSTDLERAAVAGHLQAFCRSLEAEEPPTTRREIASA
jgi:carboxylesterase